VLCLPDPSQRPRAVLVDRVGIPITHRAFQQFGEHYLAFIGSLTRLGAADLSRAVDLGPTTDK